MTINDFQSQRRRGPREEAPLRAAVFDLDGVLTRTARLHVLAWKQLFDGFLNRANDLSSAQRRPFTESDYRAHVDGRPRYDGIRAFLASRGISLPEGDPEGAEDVDTVQALGRRKNALYLSLLDREGVAVDPAALRLLEELRRIGVRIGVATSSRNGSDILRRTDLSASFDAIVDGVTSAELHLRGKPAADIFVECVRRLDASPHEALVVEDAASGIAAGRAGGFGMVIGVDRGGSHRRLREAGADVVVPGLEELSATDIETLWRGRAR